jgi:hypothetical protein
MNIKEGLVEGGPAGMEREKGEGDGGAVYVHMKMSQ